LLERQPGFSTGESDGLGEADATAEALAVAEPVGITTATFLVPLADGLGALIDALEEGLTIGLALALGEADGVGMTSGAHAWFALATSLECPQRPAVHRPMMSTAMRARLRR